jgi:hypothetical protein
MDIISPNFWRQIIIEFNAEKFALLKSSNYYLYILQGVIGTEQQNCHISFGASIALNSLNEKTLTILVDKWPFWFAAYVDRGSIPSEQIRKEFMTKQSLSQNFFEVCARGDSSPEIKFVDSKTGLSQNGDNNYTLGFSNESSDSFYISLGRAFQWSAGKKDVNSPDWQDTVGCNCFFLLDSHSTASYWNPSAEVILLLSTEKWNNGQVLPEKISGYYPCYFQLKKKKTINLYYDDDGWKKISGDADFKVLKQSGITRKYLSDLLVNNSSPTPEMPQELQYGTKFNLRIRETQGAIVSASYEMGGIDVRSLKQYFPRFTASDTPIELLLSGGSGVVKDGDTVKIVTTENSVGEYKVLGAWTTPSLYYYKDGWDNQQWTILKKNNNNPVIHYGDEVYFLNRHHKEQWLCIKDSGPYLTTKKDADAYWLIDQP